MFCCVCFGLLYIAWESAYCVVIVCGRRAIPSFSFNHAAKTFEMNRVTNLAQVSIIQTDASPLKEDTNATVPTLCALPMALVHPLEHSGGVHCTGRVGLRFSNLCQGVVFVVAQRCAGAATYEQLHDKSMATCSSNRGGRPPVSVPQIKISTCSKRCRHYSSACQDDTSRGAVSSESTALGCRSRTRQRFGGKRRELLPAVCHE